MISVRLLVDDLAPICVADVPKGRSGRVALTLREVGTAARVVVIDLVTTSLWNGGELRWWACPRCGSRRRNLLYWDRTVACRGCLGATYRSSRSSRRKAGARRRR